ncbi:hypothetical protein ONZ45_g19309 [Pleurotus djamor]|nr:hypothetical protein ONZ45_g19309 [Pleurotus djamor]
MERNDIQSVTFLNNTVIGGGTKYGTVTWKADVYIYATGARPNDADFSQRGLLNIIFLHSGYVTIYDNWSADIWNSLEFLVSVGNSNLVASLQLPQTESGAQDGDNYKYEIDYGEKMPMFKNNGNEAFDFDATFQQKFTRAASKQTGSSVKDTEFKILHTNVGHILL